VQNTSCRKIHIGTPQVHKSNLSEEEDLDKHTKSLGGGLAVITSNWFQIAVVDSTDLRSLLLERSIFAASAMRTKRPISTEGVAASL
jgi:hypothetical protein